jgi:hypothetical protein
MFWFVFITSFDIRVYYVVRWEISSSREITILLKVIAGLAFWCSPIYRKYGINVDVHLLRVFLLAVGV